MISFAERVANLLRQNDTALWLPTVAAAIEPMAMVKNVLLLHRSAPSIGLPTSAPAYFIHPGASNLPER